MTKDELIRSAKKLVQPSIKASEEYTERSVLLISEMNRRMSARKDLLDLIGGEKNLAMMENNHTNHSNFMGTLFRNYNPETYANIVVWVYNTYMAHGFKPDYWNVQLGTWLDIYKKELSASTYEAIEPFYIWIMNNHDDIVALARSKKE